MKIAYFDTIGGIAGDMTLSAFVSAGLPLDVLARELGKLGLQGVELRGSHVMRNGITAVHIDVIFPAGARRHRHLKDITTIIQGSSVSERVKADALHVFGLLANAEATIHNTSVEKVHFHEVGAVDAIVDIVGAAICLEYFGIDRVYTSPVKVGSGGLVTTEHGALPTPTPATMEILRGYPIVHTGNPHELTTPTGAALVRGFSSGILAEQQIIVDAIGYGAGTQELADLPNLLRVCIGTMAGAEETDHVHVIETNIDDMNPQIFPHLIETVLASGAIDAYLTSVVMKKGRPGHLLTVLATEEKVGALAEVLTSNTTTIGLRVQRVSRKKLPRRELFVETSFGRIRAKAVLRDGKERISAEYDECRRIAEEKGIPLIEVMNRLNNELSKS
jgi:hypothetical protein